MNCAILSQWITWPVHTTFGNDKGCSPLLWVDIPCLAQKQMLYKMQVNKYIPGCAGAREELTTLETTPDKTVDAVIDKGLIKFCTSNMLPFCLPTLVEVL